MNIKQCKNGHFYDIEAYDVCPHCGAALESDEPATEEKKPRKSIFGKKEKPHVEPQKPVSQEKGGTVGIYDIHPRTDGGIVAPTSSEDSRYQSQKVESQQEEKPQSSDKFYDEKSNIEPEPKIDSAPRPAVQTMYVQPPELPPRPAVSLKDNLKKAIDESQGKTVGIFSTATASGSDDGAVVEPVVGWLVCIKGVHFGQSFNIAVGQNSIGRSEDNKISLKRDNTVSRNKHAIITYEPKKRDFYIQPGEGSGLSYVNGDYVTGFQKVKAFDVFEFGEGQYILATLCGENFTWEDYIDKNKE